MHLDHGPGARTGRTQTQAENCAHGSLSVVQPYDQVRLYECDECQHIFACTCERWYAEAINHRLKTRALQTQEEITATLGFVEGVCPICRNTPQPPFPRAETYHSTSKFSRYWWREIEFARMRRLLARAKSMGLDPAEAIASPPRGLYEAAVKEVKQFAELHPRQGWQDESQSDVIARLGICVRDIRGVSWMRRHGAPELKWGDEWLEPEKYAMRLYQEEGWMVIQMESRPWHVLFGTFMWMVICDPTDPRVRPAMFGDRFAFERGEKGELVWYMSPDDFGSSGYGERREPAIDAHIQEMTRNYSSPRDREWLFDYWLNASKELRQYLWAHRPEDIERARQIMRVLSWDQLWRCLKVMAMDYWKHFLGWPDLFVWKDGDIRLVEVKWGKDRLSEDQKLWLDTNAKNYGFDVEILKIHRTKECQMQHGDKLDGIKIGS